MTDLNKKSVLLKNTLMLYILTFSGYFLNFITAPYQSRIFGPEIYGLLGFAGSCAVYVQLFLDFGFLLSATQDVSRERENKKRISEIFSAVFACKIILGLIALAVVTVLCITVKTLRDNILLYMLYFVATFINAMLPDFLYRGLEKMSSITYRAVSVKLFFALAIFAFLHDSDQYYVVPLLNALGGLGACIWTYYDVYKRLGVRFVKVDKRYIFDTLKRSNGYFWSRIATTVYGATNMIIIKALYPVGPVTGLYTSAEKVMTTARSAFSPIADSMYPYMTKNRDYKLVKKVLLVLMPIIIIGCTVVGIFAEPFCAILFGEEFRESGVYLQILMPVVAISLPTYIFGFPVLSPLGLAKYANISVIVGAFVHAAQLFGLYMTVGLSVVNICIATCVTEFTIFAIRIFVVFKNRNKLSEKFSGDIL